MRLALVVPVLVVADLDGVSYYREVVGHYFDTLKVVVEWVYHEDDDVVVVLQNDSKRAVEDKLEDDHYGRDSVVQGVHEGDEVGDNWGFGAFMNDNSHFVIC